MMRAECITMNLTFSHENLDSSFDYFKYFIISRDFREVYKLTDVAKF